MILGSNGIKMGKRFPEFVVNPSDVVEEYGADTLRLYEMFMGPLEVSKPWNDSNVQEQRDSSHVYGISLQSLRILSKRMMESSQESIIRQ